MTHKLFFLQKDHDEHEFIGDDVKELTYNPRYDELWTPKHGPENPNITNFHKAPKNTLTGYVEQANFSDFQFESQRRTFNNYGYAIDPSTSSCGNRIIGNSVEAAQTNGWSYLFINI